MKRAFPTTNVMLRTATRGVSALGIVLAGVAMSGVASSQTRARAGAKPVSSKASAAAPVDTSLPFLPPADLSARPAGATSVFHPAGGLSFVVMTKSFPPALVLTDSGAAPRASVSGAPIAPIAAPPSALPPVGPEDEATLIELQADSEQYRKGAASYGRAIGQIVRQRYEQKRKARLSSIQENIDRDRKDLTAARLDTIERIKNFLAKFPDVPEQTPNAMFRLASLYEEQANASDLDPADAEYTQKLKAAYAPAEFLYRDIIGKFPTYSHRPDVQFFLGALLSDTDRATEAQFVWRALVCSNHYTYPLPPPASKAEERERERWKDGIPPAPQDHDAAFWNHWRDAHYAVPDPRIRRRAPAKTASAFDPEDSYKEIYPDDCKALDTTPDSTEGDLKYIPQSWYQLAEYHFNRQDGIAEEAGYFGADPYQFNRAYSAYQHAITTDTSEGALIRTYSMYRVAWTLFNQQRFTAARNAYVALLSKFDDDMKKDGSSGDPQMREDAYTYIAASLTHLDMDGPGANDPYMDREDEFSQYSGPTLEAKLEIAIDRVQSPTVVPQDKTWTIKVYKALAAEFESDELQRDAVKSYELVLKKWDCDPEAPQFQNKVAQLYDLLALKAESPAEKDDYATKALEARTRLLSYVGTDSKWVQCNKGNPDAIRAAESLMTEGVKVAAAKHTQLGRGYYSTATSKDQGSPESNEAYRRSREEYKLAEKGWSAYLAQDTEADDAYDSRYWIADARHREIECTRALKEPLDPNAVEAARQAAVDVRDSNLGDKFLRYAAFFAVEVYDLLAEEKIERFRNTGCVAKDDAIERPDGPLAEPGDACRIDSEKESRDPEARRVWVREIPPAIVRTLKEREEFIAKVPASLDADGRIPKFRKEIADTLYDYGHFDEATPLYEAMWHDHCGKDELGFDSWYRLALMSNYRGDTKRSVYLVDQTKTKSCAINEEEKLEENAIAEPTKIRALYTEAEAAMKAAEAETDPAKRGAKFREAAAKYELALKTAPSRPEAPEGAINAAYCYKQVNEYKRATEVYRLFLDKYGREDDLISYRDGNAKKGIKKDPDAFKQRLKFTKQALDELGRTYLQSFDYSAAAKHYDEVASRTLLDEGDRRDAAQNAVVLQANLGNRDAMLKALTRYSAMHPGAADHAEVDFIVADFEYKLWRQKPSDATQRVRAVSALEKYYGTYSGQSVASKFVVDAAYEVATMRRAAGEANYLDWYHKTMAAFATFKSANKDTALGTLESDYGAEAAYYFTDEKIQKEWDAQPGQPPRIKYEGTAEKVLHDLDIDSRKRDELATELEGIISTYLSPRWTPIVYAREGSLFDVQRTALAKAKVEVIDPVLAKKISSIETIAQKILDDPTSSPAAQEKAQHALEQADHLRTEANDKWKTLRQKYFDAMESPMIDRFTRAYVRGKQFDVQNALVTKAVQRLAYYTDQLDDTKMRQYVAGVEKDFSKPPTTFKYRDQMFKQVRPGAKSDVTTDVSMPAETAAPMPVGGAGG